MELICFGAIFLWALIFAVVFGVSAILSPKYDNSVKDFISVFPADSYEIFTSAERITLYLLNSNSPDISKKDDRKSEQQFYGYDISGRRELSREQQKELKENFTEAANFRSVSKHFEPDYGLHIENGEDFVDMLISFNNSTFVIHFGGKKRIGSFYKSSESLLKQTLENIRDSQPAKTEHSEIKNI